MRIFTIAALILALWPTGARAVDKPDYLDEDESEQLREAQDPSQRIEAYLSLAQIRLTRFDDVRSRPADPTHDVAGYLDTQLDQYIRITDDLKNWIEEHYERRDDMRAGLKKFMEMGPHQIDQLRHAEEDSSPYAAEYHRSLGDAIDNFSDALDGATKALSDQVKLFGELKREEKADAQAVKERAHEEKKRTKEEVKLRHKEHEKGPPTDPDED